MSMSKNVLFALGFAAFLVAGHPAADAAPGVAIPNHPSALGPGALVYGPEDTPFALATAGRGQ